MTADSKAETPAGHPFHIWNNVSFVAFPFFQWYSRSIVFRTIP
jgi:hypothetical protein